MPWTLFNESKTIYAGLSIVTPKIFIQDNRDKYDIFSYNSADRISVTPLDECCVCQEIKMGAKNHIIEQAVEAATKKQRCFDYLFYGDCLKSIQCKPIRQFPGITTLFELFAVLECCWSKDTAFPTCQKEWISDDPSYGQSAITATLVHDMFRGTIHEISVRGGGKHYFNILEGQIVDLAREQFDLYNLPVNYDPNREVSREYCLNSGDTYQRYRQLQRNIIHFLNPKKNLLYEQTGFEQEKTILYIKVNGNWEKGTFLRFDIKNGNDIVYVEYLNRERFYAFPSEYVSVEEPKITPNGNQVAFQVISKKEAVEERILQIETTIDSLYNDIFQMKEQRSKLHESAMRTVIELRQEIDDENGAIIGNDINNTWNEANGKLKSIDHQISSKENELFEHERELQQAKNELHKILYPYEIYDPYRFRR